MAGKGGEKWGVVLCRFDATCAPVGAGWLEGEARTDSVSALVRARKVF
jgi:hypothetical protein